MQIKMLCHIFLQQVMYIQALVIVVLLGKLMKKVFFGQLRAAEVEVCIKCYCVCVYPNS